MSVLQYHPQIPRTFGIIDRPRLMGRLRAVADHKVTVLSAPPGYGKTTIVAQFAQESPYPVVWHTIEERERDVPNLFAQSVAVLSSVLPDIDQLQPGYRASPAELATLVADYLRDHLADDIVYILDDLQHLADSTAAETWLRTFVARMPSTCHLILLSRILPPLPFAEMLVRGEVVAIGQDELRLTLSEIQMLAYEMLGVSPPQSQVQDLAERLEGWPAGTVLALHPLPPELERAMLNGGQGPEALFEALADSMLAIQSPELRDFLLASSTLGRLTPELCSSALGLLDTANWLAEIQSRNLFLSRVTGGLAYHRLFRSFLQRYLEDHNPDLFRRLHRQTAKWFEQHGETDDAFDHYIMAGAPERAALISERVAQAYFTQGKLETLLRWSRQLQQVLAEAPRLLLTCAKVYTDRLDYNDAEVALRTAEIGFEDRGDAAGFADVQLQRAKINLQRGNYPEAASQAAHLLEMEPMSVKVRGQALRILGVAHLRLGQADTALRYLEESLPLHRQDGDAHELANLLQDMGVVRSRLGQFDAASACLQEVVALRRSLGNAGTLALALNNLGYYYHRGSDYRQAMLTFQEGLSVVAKLPNRRAESYLLWSLGDLQRDQDAWNEALQAYDKSLDLIGDSEPALRSSILTSISTLHRWREQFAEAISVARESATLADKHNLALESVVAQAAVWAACAQIGQAEEALNRLDEIAASLQKQSAKFDLIRVWGLCAHAALLGSDTRTAEYYLQSACRLAQEIGSSQPLVAEIVHTPLLETLVARPTTLYEPLRRDLKRLRDVQQETVTQSHWRKPTIPQVTYSLRIKTFGQEQIERDGLPIPTSIWRATAARELFFYLLFMGATSREDISLEFWPDSSSQRVRANFHTTMHRARKALGENSILFQNDLYFINPELEVWCDAFELETLVRRARLMPPRDALTEDLWRRAVELYPGDFLPSLDTDWVFTRREALRELYVEALVGLGRCVQSRRDFGEALRVFREALEVDPFREDIHRAIMTCYADKGEKKRIRDHLKELETLLWEELGVEPSEETLTLAQSLLN
jgi:LuxR family maltose regulon positive regulatory protein